jgi:pilus assembly protein CpaE
MSKQAHSEADEDPQIGRELVLAGMEAPDEDLRVKARPIPRISIQAFCENTSTAEAVQAATGDRRLAKSHVSVHMGGAPAAVAHYQESPTPNLIVVETSLPRTQLLAELDGLAECCDAGPKVVVIGRTNYVTIYREL